MSNNFFFKVHRLEQFFIPFFLFFVFSCSNDTLYELADGTYQSLDGNFRADLNKNSKILYLYKTLDLDSGISVSLGTRYTQKCDPSNVSYLSEFEYYTIVLDTLIIWNKIIADPILRPGGLNNTGIFLCERKIGAISSTPNFNDSSSSCMFFQKN